MYRLIGKCQRSVGHGCLLFCFLAVLLVNPKSQILAESLSTGVYSGSGPYIADADVIADLIVQMLDVMAH
ncbi:hypothetical protein JOE50_008054 [Bradyrhizobium japonicum]|nr:hypothetical protein [Bradyrhizobium japonicum]